MQVWETATITTCYHYIALLHLLSKCLFYPGQNGSMDTRGIENTSSLHKGGLYSSRGDTIALSTRETSSMKLVLGILTHILRWKYLLASFHILGHDRNIGRGGVSFWSLASCVRNHIGLYCVLCRRDTIQSWKSTCRSPCLCSSGGWFLFWYLPLSEQMSSSLHTHIDLHLL